jgi:hypothetical protein
LVRVSQWPPFMDFIRAVLRKSLGSEQEFVRRAD